jgi:hypothetical protein
MAARQQTGQTANCRDRQQVIESAEGMREAGSKAACTVAIMRQRRQGSCKQCRSRGNQKVRVAHGDIRRSAIEEKVEELRRLMDGSGKLRKTGRGAR